jgi:transposase-like protein
LQRVKNHWLKQNPEERCDYPEVLYMVYDATYFHKDGCLLNLMDATNQKIIAHLHVKKESFNEAYPWFMSLKLQGLYPMYITTDGERSVLRALKAVWPQAKRQRCLYHLQHEGMRWLRSYPKTEAGKALRTLLSGLSQIKTEAEKDSFVQAYSNWVNQYKVSVNSLPRTTVASKDLRRTMVLINNALGDMFHYLGDSRVHATTNALEGFHSRLKADYRRHRGLSKGHRIQFIDWYCYFENTSS